MKNILITYIILIISVIFLTTFSKAVTSDVKETINIHFGENTPCMLAVKAKYGCWPWDSCAFYEDLAKNEVSK